MSVIATEIDIGTVVSCVSLAVTIFVAYMSQQTKLEVANLKIWIYENFEHRKQIVTAKKTVD